MPCMCGDPNCGSCGPAQGFDSAYEAAYEDTYDKITDIFTKHGLNQHAVAIGEQVTDVRAIDELVAIEELTQLALANAQDTESAREAGFFECIDQIERLYQTREERVTGLTGERMVTRNPRITDDHDVALLKRVVRELKGLDDV